jgi:hypothetical protein
MWQRRYILHIFVLLLQVNDWDVTDPSRQNAHVTVFNNMFNGIPTEYHDCAPLLAGYVVNNSFVHNSILSPSNTGIRSVM